MARGSYVPRRSATRESRPPQRFHSEYQIGKEVEFRRDEVRGLDQPSDGAFHIDAAVRRKMILRRQGTFVYDNFLRKEGWKSRPLPKSLTENYAFYAPHVQKEDEEEGSTKFTGYESIAKQFRCNNQDAVELLRNTGHNIPEERRRILLDNAGKAAQQFREAERWQYLPSGSGAGPILDAINLGEACGLDFQWTISDEEEGNVKSAATIASLWQHMSDTDDEATVAFETSDAEDDADQKPPAKASPPPQENAMTREDGKPPAKASLHQKTQTTKESKPQHPPLANVVSLC
jgi:hypothetical protein